MPQREQGGYTLRHASWPMDPCRLNSTFWVNSRSLGNPKNSGYPKCKIRHSTPTYSTTTMHTYMDLLSLWSCPLAPCCLWLNACIAMNHALLTINHTLSISLHGTQETFRLDERTGTVITGVSRTPMLASPCDDKSLCVLSTSVWCKHDSDEAVPYGSQNFVCND